MAKGRQQYFADEVSIQKEAREFAIEEQLKAKIDSIEEGAQVNVIETVKVNGAPLIPDAEKAVDVSVPVVEDTLYSIDTEAALSARQGKVLYDYILNLQSRGRYLSNWNCATGLPTTNPYDSPYEYRAGDYFLVSNVSTGTNYKPDGSEYVIGVASTTVETEIVGVSDMYIYDGETWQLIINSERPIAIDDALSPTSTNPVENRVVTQAIGTKQNIITDLQTIREGAALGATSLQPGDSITELTGTSDDITEGTSHLFMTPQEKTKLGNQTGVNTGDETQATIMAKLGAASATTNGYLTSADWSTFNNKQDAISDLQTIRDNAQAGKNASDTIATYGDIVTHNVSEFASSSDMTQAQSDITSLQGDMTQTQSDITSLQGDMTQAQSDITQNANDIVGLDTRLDNAENDIDNLQSDMTTAQGNITQIQTDLAGKQDTLVAGANIQIDPSTNTISSTDTTYTAGPGISISANNVISNTQTSAEWGNIQGTLSNQTDLQNALNEKQGTLTAGDNITIDPATNTISAQVPDSAEWGNITGTLSDQTDLQIALNAKADATDINTKTFYLSSTSDLTTAQAAYDWYLAGKTPIIGWNGGTFILSRYDAPNMSGALLKFREGYRKITGVWDNKYTAIGDGYVIRFVGSNNTVSQIDIGESMNYSYGYLSPGINYSNPYTPEYAGSPATKKYVDDAVAGAGGNYTAGNGIDITNNEISIDTSVVATQTDVNNKVSKGVNQSNGQLFSIEDTNGFSNNFGPDYIRVDFNDGTNSGSAGIQWDSLGAMSNNETSNLDYERLLLRNEVTMESASYQKDKIHATDQNLDSEDYEFSGGGDNQIARLKDAPYVGTSAPSNPVEGRLWYDATNDVLKSYDGTAWKEAGTQMKILSYGHSTWQDFLNAYNENAVVYCRASSSSDPSTGSQGRLAFMAYVNNAGNPTEVEFQYYRSRNDHNSAANQLDEVYVYKLVPASGGTWTVTQRNTGAKAVAGTGIGLSFGSGNMTISNSGVTSFNGDTGAITLAPGTYLSLNNNVIDVDTSLIATKADIANFAGFQVVAQLPTTDIKTNIIYLLGPVGTGADKYEEYIYSNNAWIMIGDTTIDLSPYLNVNTQTSDAITEGSTNLFLTTAERTKLTNTSGTNTGDETKATIQSKLGAASSSNSGYLTSADYDTFMAKADPSDVNTKAFYLQSDSDTTTAQEAIDWIRAGNTAILKLKVGNQDYYYYYSYADWSMTSIYHFVRADNLLVGAVDGTSTSHQKYSVLNISVDMTQSTPTVTSIYVGDTTQEDFEVLRTGYNYPTPYTPQYDGSPATKKYVDDAVAGGGGYRPIFFAGSSLADIGAALASYLNTYSITPSNLSDVGPIGVWEDGPYYLQGTPVITTDAQYRFTFQSPTTQTTTRNNSYSWTNHPLRRFVMDWDSTNSVWSYNSSDTSYVQVTSYNYLRTDVNYPTPYTPQYAGSPATKKYVDDTVAASISSAITNETAGTTSSINKIWVGTEAEYQAITTYDEHTAYMTF